MGETREDRMDLAVRLKELDTDSAPINFLDPRPGTGLAGQDRLTPNDGLRTLAMFRFVLVRVRCCISPAGGRPACAACSRFRCMQRTLCLPMAI